MGWGCRASPAEAGTVNSAPTGQALLLSPLYRWGEGGTERLPEVTQLGLSA